MKIPPAKNGKPKPERSEAEVAKLLGRPRRTIARWTDISVGHVANANTRAGVANTPPAGTAYKYLEFVPFELPDQKDRQS